MKDKGSHRMAINEVQPLTLDKHLEFFRIVLSLQHELHRLSQITQRSFGITTTQRVVLQLTARFPGITPSRLAVSLSIPLSTFSGILAKMKRGKLVRAVVDKGDERRTQIFATEKGRALLERSDNNVERALLDATAASSEQSLDSAKDYLLNFVKSLNIRDSLTQVS